MSEEIRSYRSNVSDIADAVRRGELDATELASDCTNNTDRVNSGLNALVASASHRTETALAGLPDRILSGSAQLAGVPFVISESVAVAGAPHTSGSKYRSGMIADSDATSVSRLIDAGAIPVGVTNTSEVGFSVETSNTVYGRTRNPFDRRRIAGGALGGAAALVATGGARFGIGVDMTGSARMSALACGVVSLKPTGGLVPLTGFEPFPNGRMRRFATMGVVARSALDLEPILRVMSGPDGTDGAAVNYTLRPVADYDLLWKHVLVCDDMNLRGIKVSREVKQAVHTAAEILGERGAEVEDWRPRQFNDAFLVWLAMVHEGHGFMHDFSSSITCGEDESWAGELLRLPFRRSVHTAPLLAMGVIEKLTRTSLMHTYRLAAEGRRLKERLNILLQDGGLLVLPAYPESTPRTVRTLRGFRKLAYSSIINTLELPSVTVPVSRCSDGLPIAIQIVAGRGREDACIAAAAVIESSVRPPPTPSMRKIARWG